MRSIRRVVEAFARILNLQDSKQSRENNQNSVVLDPTFQKQELQEPPSKMSGKNMQYSGRYYQMLIRSIAAASTTSAVLLMTLKM